MINIRRDALERGEIPERKCLLDFMLEISKNNPNFTDDDIVNEACTFMLAGQDSVGAGIKSVKLTINLFKKQND